MFTRADDMSLYALARSVEVEALRLLEEYKPGRRLQTNVEFYTALLLHGLGFDVPLFTPTFALQYVFVRSFMRLGNNGELFRVEPQPPTACGEGRRPRGRRPIQNWRRPGLS